MKLVRYVAHPSERLAQMSAESSIAERRGSWGIAMVVALGCHLLWHAHGIASGRFQNLDVAGIVYNARLLLAGRLPYVDSVEIKPPGAFLLFAPWVALGGLKAVWWFSTVWGAMTSLASGWLGALCWGDKWGPRIAILHAAGAAVAADGDINYSFWMTLPFVLSAVFSLRAARAETGSSANVSWLMAGGLGAFAVLVRPSALTVAMVFVAALIPDLRARKWRNVSFAVAYGTLGVVLVALLMALPFVRGGSLSAMIDGYGSIRRYADESVKSILVGAGGRIPATLTGLQCLPDQLPVYHLLLSVALLPSHPKLRATGKAPLGYLAWVFAVASLIGISLTLRFFTHDNAPIWAALSVLILRPTSLIGIAVEACSRVRCVELGLAFGLGILAPLSNWQSLTWLQNYMHESDAQVARLCERVGPHLAASDTVLAWGWSAWGVYEHCRRWAPGPVYKDLTTVTTPNTNTCNRGYEPPRLKSGPFADRYLRDLERHRPALVVVSDYYRGLGADPLDEWWAAKQILSDNYVVYETHGGFQALLRRDFIAQSGLMKQPVVPLNWPKGTTAMNELPPAVYVDKTEQVR